MYLYKLVLKNGMAYIVESEKDIVSFLETEIKAAKWNSFYLVADNIDYVGYNPFYTNMVTLKIDEIIGIENYVQV